MIFSIGGESIAERENLQQLKVLRGSHPKYLWSSSPTEMMRTTLLPHLALERRALSIAKCPPRSRFKLYPSSSMAAHIFRHPLCINFRLDLNKLSLQLALRKIPKSESKHNGKEGNGGASAHSRSNLACHLGTLTARQQEVLDHLRLGETNKLIARQLGMTEGTVKVHIRQMMRKCQVSNRTQLAVGGSTVAISAGGNHIMVKKSPEQDLGSTAKPVDASLIGTASRVPFGNY